MLTLEQCAKLLSEGLDLCVRARKLDAIDRRAAALSASSDPEEWQRDGLFDRYVERHNIEYPDTPLSTRSMTIPLWMNEQYQTDLAAWEAKARKFLLESGLFERAALQGGAPGTGE